MRISEIMTGDVVSVPPDCSLDDATRLFESCRFRHLPVVEKERLVGMISDRDVALATGWILSSYRNAAENNGPLTVGQVMRADVFTLEVEDSIQEAVAIVLDHRVSAVPLLRRGRLAGIVTTTDLLRASRNHVPNHGWNIDPGAQVRSSMSSELITVGPDELIDEALDRCQKELVRHVPVVEAGRLVGLISDRDLRFGLGQEIVSDQVAQDEGRLEVSQTPVSALMATELVTIAPGDRLTEAADRMIEHGFGSLPVVEEGRLVGIITQTDILRSCC